MPKPNEGRKIRQKYASERTNLNDCFAKDLPYKDKVLDKAGYRIARRTIVLLRQKELLEAGVVENDEMLDENNQPMGVYELDIVKSRLLTGVEDKLLVCPDDPYPHNPYPIKVVQIG